MTHPDPHWPADGSDHPHDDGWGAGGQHDDHGHHHGHHGDGHHGHEDAHHPHDHHESVTADEVRVHGDGAVEFHTAHTHGHVSAGDYVDVRLPNGDHVTARVTDDGHDGHGLRAVVAANDARSLLDHLPVRLLGEVVEAGAEVAFDHLLHAAEVVCFGHVHGTDGEHLLLGGAGAGPGADGAPVFDDAGHLVGQVVGFNAEHGVNLMVTADHLMSGLADFANWAAESVGSTLTSLLD